MESVVHLLQSFENMEFEEDLLAGIRAIAKQKYWKRDYWRVDGEDEITSLLFQHVASLWKIEDIPNTQAGRVELAKALAHRCRWKVKRHIEKYWTRIEIMKSRTGG